MASEFKIRLVHRQTESRGPDTGPILREAAPSSDRTSHHRRSVKRVIRRAGWKGYAPLVICGWWCVSGEHRRTANAIIINSSII